MLSKRGHDDLDFSPDRSRASSTTDAGQKRLRLAEAALAAARAKEQQMKAVRLAHKGAGWPSGGHLHALKSLTGMMIIPCKHCPQAMRQSEAELSMLREQHSEAVSRKMLTIHTFTQILPHAFLP